MDAFYNMDTDLPLRGIIYKSGLSKYAGFVGL